MYIVKAEANQVEKIVDMSIRAFETDVNVGGAKGECPPGFDSVEWHKQKIWSVQPYYSRMKPKTACTLAEYLLIASIIEKVTEFV